MIPDNGLFKALKEALFCDLNKLRNLGSNIADKKSPCGIPMEAVKQRAAVNADNVAVTQTVMPARNAVHDPVIDRSADACREALVIQE